MQSEHFQQQLLAAYVQKPTKEAYYQAGLAKMEKAGAFEFKWHWSWWAFLGGWAFLLYRKAYKAAALTFVASLLANFIPFIGPILYMIVIGGIAPYFVLERYHDLAEELQGSEADKLAAMQSFGGVNNWVIWVTVIIYSFILIGALTMGLPANMGGMLS